MAFNFLFKTPKPRRFHYDPIFYDPEKEAREERIKRIMKEVNATGNGEYKPGLTRGTFREYYKRTHKSDRYRTLRLMIIVFILLMLAYFLIFR